MADCIFCKIAAGEIPCTRVYEDDVCLAFMDIGPIAPGHTLVIPKVHVERLADLPADTAAHIARRLGPLAAAVQGAMDAAGVNLLQNNGTAAGQQVPHLHYHLIPRRPNDGLGFRWPAKKADFDALKTQAEAIRGRLKE
jgi:histidine triad (HIT) family protein